MKTKAAFAVALLLATVMPAAAEVDYSIGHMLNENTFTESFRKGFFVGYLRSFWASGGTCTIALSPGMLEASVRAQMASGYIPPSTDAARALTKTLADLGCSAPWGKKEAF